MKIKNFVLSLRLRVKLLLAFASILLLSTLLIIFSITSINKIIRVKAMNEEVDKLNLYLESIALSSKEFMYEGYRSRKFLLTQQNESIDQFENSYRNSKAIILEIGESHFIEDGDRKNLTTSLSSTLDSLHAKFYTLVELLKKRGFKDHGLEGDLRKAIHNVENSQVTFDKATMLTLRRHEKDFFLRKELKYQNNFNDVIDEFYTQLEADVAANEIVMDLKNYKEAFNKVVDIEVKIGLKDTEGIKGDLLSHLKNIRPQLNAFRTVIKQKNEHQISSTKKILLVIFFTQLFVGFVLAIVYANLLTTAIKEIRTAMQKLASGVFPDKLTIRTGEEIGHTKMAFNHFIDRLKTATTFAERLGNGELDTKYDERFEHDVLAKSIINMQKKLQEGEERQSKINWTNQGAAMFNTILKNDVDDIHHIGDKILKLCVSYLNANQGALYIVQRNNDEEYLTRISTYAYDKKRFIDERIAFGSGMIGQCYMEKTSVHIKEIPKDYVKISSGLGAATPRNVLIVPLKIRNDVMGVIELASFDAFRQYEIDFIEQIGESIAAVLSSKQIEEETKYLLTQSKHRADTLAQQEEEMRQHAEELQATQEEMERQRMELQHEIQQLKKKLEKYDLQLA